MTSMTTVKVIVTGYKGASYPLQPMSDSVMMTTPCHRQPPGGNPQQAHLDFSDIFSMIPQDPRAVRSPPTPSHLAAMQRTLGLLALFTGAAAAISRHTRSQSD
jgi:hypothetical protein